VTVSLVDSNYILLQNHDSVIAPLHEISSFFVNVAASRVHPVFGMVGKAMDTYLSVWDQVRLLSCPLLCGYRHVLCGAVFRQMHGFYPSINPVASSSSTAPDPAAVHQCAAFTVFHKASHRLN
jgi:hypothetical protein